MNYQIKLLTLKDIPKILKLENETYEKHYIKHNEKDLKRLIKEKLSYGVFENNNLIGFSTAYKIDNFNIKKIFKKKNIINDDPTILLSSTYIKQEHRGRNFQIQLREKLLSQLTQCNILCLVACSNQYSIKNIRKLKMKKIHQQRHIGDNVSYYYKMV